MPARVRPVLRSALAAGIVVFLGLLAAVLAGALGAGSPDAHADAAAHALVRHDRAVLAVARDVTLAGAPAVDDALVVVAALLLWLARRRRAAMYVLAVRALTEAVTTVVKVAVARARPVLPHPVAHAGGYSFPSGHASGAASAYLPIALVVVLTVSVPVVRRAVAALTVVWCLAVAASRVLLGVHFPSDVAAGLALGVAATAGLALPLLVPHPTPDARPPGGQSAT